MIPVWFFVGVILLIYGLIILGTGIYEFKNPPPTVLANTHPALWWGALLTSSAAFMSTFTCRRSLESRQIVRCMRLRAGR